MKELLGIEAKIEILEDQKGDVQITCADISKAKSILNFDPSTKIEEGIKKTIDWYKKK